MNKIIFAHLIFLFSISMISAQNLSDDGTGQTGSFKTSTLFIPLKRDGLTAEEEHRINQALYFQFSDDKNINLVNVNFTKLRSAASLNEAVKTGEKYKADRVIYGKIIYSEVSGKKALDDEGADQYILVQTDNKIFKIYLYAADVKQKKNLKTYTGNLVKGNVRPAASEISAYFRQNPDKAESAAAVKPATEDIKQEDLPAEADENNFIFSFGFAMNGQYSLFSFSEITDYNAGASVYFRIENMLFTGLTASLKLTGDYSLSTAENISDYYNYSGSMNVGYKFLLPANMEIIPLLSVGMINHAIDADQGSGNYRDTVTGIGADFLYRFSPRHALFLSASYNLFYEKTQNGHFISAELGYEYRFNVSE